MQVIFLEDVLNVARAGDVKEVKSGYARNYLLPRRLAVAATRQEMERLDTIKRAGDKKRLQEEHGMQVLAEQLEGTSIAMQVRAGPNGKLYGAVTSAMIAQEISNLIAREFDRRCVLMEEPLHELGTFPVALRLNPQVSASITVVLEPL